MKKPGENGASSRGAAACAALLAGCIALIAWYAATAPALDPPSPIPATAPAAEFSAERARAHLYEITRSYRPVGSPGHARTHEYIATTLQELGLETEVQRTTSVQRYPTFIGAALVQNIIARLPGRDPTGAVVLMAHYDSAVNSYGAGDAGNGVAAILETARALLADGSLQNDVIFLFTDAEEAHLYGARAYVTEHRWASETGIVLNAEGRGNTGPVVMFRTSGRNGPIVRTVARSSPRPVASSIWSDLFEHLPPDTDLSVFLEADMAGVDFANVSGFLHYHSPLDSYENADPRSLQHHGGYLLSLSRAFGEMDLTDLDGPDHTYFVLPLLGMIHYPGSWNLPFTAIVLLLTLHVLVLERRRGRLSPADAGWGALYGSVVMMVGPLLMVGLWHLVSTQLPEVRWFRHGAPYDGPYHLLAMSLLAVAGAIALLTGFGKRASSAGLLLGPIAVLALPLMATALWLPGLSVVFLWPLLFTILGLWWAGNRDRPYATQSAVLAVLAIPILFFMIPAIEGAETMVTLSMVAAPAVILWLTIGLLGLQLEHLARSLSWTLPLLLCLIGGGMLLAGVLTAGFDDERKKPNGVNYIADADEEEAWWYSLDPEPDEWTRRYLGPDPARAPLPDWAPQSPFGVSGLPWVARAPRLRDDAPEASILGHAPTEEGRRVRLRITSPPGAHVTVMEFRTGPEVAILEIDGRSIPRPQGGERSDSDGRGQYFGPGPDGFEMEIHVAGEGPVELHLRSTIPGLPELPEAAGMERPEHMMVADPSTDLTQLQRTVRLEW